MALAAPILFALILGMMEMSRVFMVKHLLQDVARQGCRLAIGSTATNSTVTAAVNAQLVKEGIHNATTAVLVNAATADCSTAVSGDKITVNVSVSSANVTLVSHGKYFTGTLKGTASLRAD